MEEDLVESYVRLGEAHTRVMELAVSMVKEGASLLEIAQRSEELIGESGYKPAFPANLSLNEVAAHYTPHPEDSTVVPDGAVLKVDLGSHSDGLIVDSARTVVLEDKYEPMVEAVRDALDAAIALMKPGRRMREIGQVIYDKITSYGFRPIYNLSGHKIERYRLHSGVDVPNVPKASFRDYKIQPGDVFAIEPFATLPHAKGFVVGTDEPLIFSFRKKVRTRDEIERRIIKLLEKEFKELPFCERWLVDRIGHRVNHALNRLVRKGSLRPYPPLVEVTGGVVAQYEDTVLVTSDGPLRLTGGLS